MRWILIAMIILHCGCNKGQLRNQRHETPERNDSAIAAKQETHAIPIQDQKFVGSYYRGDGTGFNLDLTLKNDGRFNCRWTGCLGAYGESSGTWRVEGDKIFTETLTEKDMMMKNQVGSLTIMEESGNIILVQDGNREFFDKHGPSRYSCFSRERLPQ